MAVIGEQEARELKLNAIRAILTQDPSRFAELRGQNVDSDDLIGLFDQLSPAEQLKAYSKAGVNLVDIGYGIPSEATVARFGQDGHMSKPEDATTCYEGM